MSGHQRLVHVSKAAARPILVRTELPLASLTFTTRELGRCSLRVPSAKKRLKAEGTPLEWQVATQDLMQVKLHEYAACVCDVSGSMEPLLSS